MSYRFVPRQLSELITPLSQMLEWRSITFFLLPYSYITIAIFSMYFPARFRKVLIHCCVWAVFIVYEVSALIAYGVKVTWYDFFFYYFLNIIFFYAVTYTLINYTSKKKTHIAFLIPFILFLLFIYCVIALQIDLVVNRFHHGTFVKHFTRSEYYLVFYRGLYFIGISMAYWVGYYLIEQTKSSSHLKLAVLKAENAYLQAQINPHLLFNTLNYIQSKVARQSLPVAESINLLADTMRYSLHNEEKIELQKEIEQIERYTALNQLLHEDRLNIFVRLDTDKNLLRHKIPPLLLLTLVENVFTHGDLTDNISPAVINISCHGNRLHFRSENSVRKTARTQTHGIGITNIRTRLENYYTPETASLQIQETENVFIADLTIEL